MLVITVNIFSKALKHFVKPARTFFNMKPFGITIHKEIDNLQMDLIHQVLRDYKLKGRRKFEYNSYREYHDRQNRIWFPEEAFEREFFIIQSVLNLI